MKYIGVYSLDLIPESDSRIVNSIPFSTIEEAQTWLNLEQRSKSSSQFWNPHIVNEEGLLVTT